MATQQTAAESVEAPATDRLEEPDEGQRRESVTVVLPCLNEEDSVGLVVTEALQTLEAAGIPGEVLVVDNGSSDDSVNVALSAGARVIHERRPGYGRAVRTGIAEAKGCIVVMADADWTYDMTKLPDLIDPIQRGVADLAVGARLHQANRETMPILHRYVGTPALTAFIRTAGGYTGLTDSQSGYRCFRRDTILALGLRADGMELTSDMLLRASLRNLTVVEVPTGYRKRIGQSKLNTFEDGMRNLRVFMSLAPEAFFLIPGLLLLLAGCVLTVASFLPSRGIEVGSFRWQPVFFASIALVLGLQTVMVGLVFAWRTANMAGSRLLRAIRFISAPAFPGICSLSGVFLLIGGLALDGLLFGRWLSGRSTGITDLPLAAFAQAVILAGGSMASFGLVVMWLHWERRQGQQAD